MLTRAPIASRHEGSFLRKLRARAGQSTVCYSWTKPGRKTGCVGGFKVRTVVKRTVSLTRVWDRTMGLRKRLLLTLQLVLVKLDL